MSRRPLIGLVLLLVATGSIGTRWFISRNDTAATEVRQDPSSAARRLAGGDSLVPTGTTNPQTPAPAPTESEPGTAEKTLPVVSEASFFAMVGFALGYFAKKLVKLALIFLALVFIVLQVLGYVDIISINWSRAVELFNRVVIGATGDQGFITILKNRLPAGAGLGGGYILGYRKG